MIYNYLKTAFPFVMQLAKQSRFVKPAQFMPGVIAPDNTLLPFIARVPNSSDATVTALKVYDSDGILYWEAAVEDLAMIHLEKIGGGVNYIWYQTGINVDLINGRAYYLGLTYGGTEYYSEIFIPNCFKTTDVNIPFVKLEWDNDGCDLPPILYQSGFKNVMYLDTVVAQEAPTIYEEATEDAIKNSFPTLQKYVDNFSLQCVVPFFQVEALTLMCMHKRVTIQTPGPVYEARIRDMRPTVTQLEGGYLYLFEMKFQQDTEYLNNACCENMAFNGLTAVDDAYDVYKNDPLTVLASGVMENDVAEDPSTLSVVAGTFATAHGSIVMSSDGGFVYTPETGYVGPDSYTYTLTNGGETDTAVINFNVKDMDPGMIMMWSGNPTAVPSGWALCNGEGGTPDLRGKFIAGYDSSDTDYDAIGKIGGAKTTTLTMRNLPAVMPLSVHLWNEGGATHLASGGDDDEGEFTDNFANPGGGQAFDKRPSFYTLAYIIKL